MFFSAVFSAKADDGAALNSLQTAEAAFSKRTAFTKDEAVVDQALADATTALQQATSNEVKFQILNFQSRVLVWKGLHTSQKGKGVEKIYEEAYAKADEARNLNEKEFTKYAEGNYRYSVALGRWALEKGPLTVLGRVGEMKSALDAALDGETLEGELGETYDYFGPDRVYGRLYLELPGLAGGDKKKALKHLESAVTNAPDHTLNQLYYAQALEANKQTEKACQVLTNLLAVNPLTLIPERAADAQEDLADAKKVFADICK